ncbi:MAG: GDP-L-fucose synthase [Alphaproteobacteria bacterium]|nr:GDP-L-fucose synthase [Alphaproteobacteria bacterium]
MEKTAKILVTGASGMVGGSLVRCLQSQGFENVLTPTHTELDLTVQADVNAYFENNRPQYVFHLAARVGGIHANSTYPGQFIYQNTAMQTNVMEACRTYNVSKLLFPGSACTYPKMAPQPIQEESFLNGPIEPTNIAYAAAKINGLVMAQSYAKEYGLKVALPMPTNTYGVGDNFDPQASHVIPALMTRLHDAKETNLPEVVLWGTGKPQREFLYVDDLADALIFLMKTETDESIINVGTMAEISIFELAQEIAKVVGYTGELKTDPEKPDGAPRKCLDNSKLKALGWIPKTTLQNGLQQMYDYHFKAGEARRTGT